MPERVSSAMRALEPESRIAVAMQSIAGRISTGIRISRARIDCSRARLRMMSGPRRCDAQSRTSGRRAQRPGESPEAFGTNGICAAHRAHRIVASRIARGSRGEIHLRDEGLMEMQSLWISTAAGAVVALALLAPQP